MYVLGYIRRLILPEEIDGSEDECPVQYNRCDSSVDIRDQKKTFTAIFKKF